jgi:hypothetical protein
MSVAPPLPANLHVVILHVAPYKTPCRVGLTPVTDQLHHEAFPRIDADATCRNDAAHHCKDSCK